MRNTGRKDEQRSGPSVVLLPLDLYAHRAGQDVEDLVDHVRMPARWGPATWWGPDPVDAAVSGTRRLIEQPLGKALFRTRGRERCLVNLTHVLHSYISYCQI